MRRWLALRGLWLGLGSFGLLAVSTAHSAEPADAVPDSASVVLRVKAPQAALNNLGDFVDAVQPGFGAVVKGNLGPLGLAISNPGLIGVDSGKDWWAIVFAESRQQPPALVFVIPTTNADDLKGALPPGFEFHAADKLAVYSDNAEALGKVRDRMSGKGAAIWSQVDVSTKKLFEASDLSVLVHLKQLTKAFETELQQAEPQLDGILDQISGAVPDAQRTQLIPILDMYRLLGKSALQGVRDSQCLTIGWSFSKEAIRQETRLQVAAGTKAAKFLAAQPTSELSLLNRLPTDKSVYFAVKADMSGMIDWSMKLSKSMLGNLSAEQQAQFDTGVKEMRGLKWNEFAGYFAIDAASEGAMRAGTVMEVTPTDKMRDLSRAMTKAMGEIQTPGFKQTSKLEAAVDKIGGIEVDRITMQQEFDPSLDPFGMQKKIQTVLFGENGMQQWVMYQPNRVLQVLGGGKPELESLVSSVANTTANDAARTAARKRFAEKANVVVLADLPQLVIGGIKLASREKLIPIDVSVLDGLQLPPSYIGGAVFCEPTAIQGQLEIPVAQAQGIARILMTIRSVRQ